MNTSSEESCAGRRNRRSCNSEVTHACNCGNPVVFLCSKCVITHLSEPVTHTFISLEQARALIKNVAYTEVFNDDLSKYSKLKSSLESYIRQIEAYREKAESDRDEICNSIKRKFRSKLDLLKDVKVKAQEKLEVVKKRMNEFTQPGDEMLRNFETNGLKGVLSHYIESFKVNKNLIEEAGQKIFSLSYKCAEEAKEIKKTVKVEDGNISEKPAIVNRPKEVKNNFIYYPKKNSKQMVEYDIQKNKLRDKHLRINITQKFNNSSSCLLPNGDVIIVGRYKPDNGDTFRFNPHKNRVQKLGKLNNTRSLVGLICNDKCIYAFGGYVSGTDSASNKAERMELKFNKWDDLPDMKQPRSRFGMVFIDNRIYLIGGINCCTVEYYDIHSNSFNLILGKTVPTSGCIAALSQDRIYVIASNLISIYSKDFDLIKGNIKHEEIYSGTLNSVVIKETKVYFNCFNTDFIHMFDPNTEKVSRII